MIEIMKMLKILLELFLARTLALVVVVTSYTCWSKAKGGRGCYWHLGLFDTPANGIPNLVENGVGDAEQERSRN